MADHARTELATSPFDAPLEVAARRARDWVRGLPDRPVGARAGLADLRAALDVPLTDEGADPATVVRELADASEPGLVATGSPRYFGFVIGGALPAALAADWLASAWDQNAGLHVGGPAAAVVEEIAGRWVLDLLGLPAGASFGFVTGCQMAHVTALAAARNDVLARAGWDVERQGLVGAPPVRVLAGEARHATLDRALRLLGLGTDAVEPVACGPDGRVRLDALAERLGRPGAAGPTIVCAQVGEVNTGAVDPVAEICDLAHDHGAWVHVDGAFGLWAAASPALRPLVAGVERADSWATDFHKWLNVPYDSGFAACAHPASHRAAMGTRADYLVHAEPDGPRDQMDWNPEFSRRARGFAVYAALRSLGRRGVADLVERCCALARRAAGALARLDGVEVLNDVVLDQMLVGFRDVDAGRVVEEVQRSGECWMSGTTWQGRPAMRISVINWQTGEDDVDRAVAAIEAAVASLTRVSPNRSEPYAAGMATALQVDDIDLSDLDFWLRPMEERAEAFALLRAERPIARMVLPGVPHLGLPESEYWAVTRYEDIVEVSRHPELFCSGKGTNIPDLPPSFNEFFGSMINMDDPRHARMRRIVSRGFTPRQLEKMRTDVEGVARQIVDEICERGEADVVTEVAARLPLRIILDMMGIPRSEERFVFDRTNVILGFTDPEYVDVGNPEAVTAAILTAGAELAQLVQELGEARIRDPRDDLVTALVTSEVDGEKLSPQELASFFVLLVVAGNETTRNAIAHGLWAFTQHPDQWERWRADVDGLATTAVEEIVRWASPVLHFRRTVTRDGVRLRDHEFAEGDKVVMWYWSGNRDEAVFEDPLRFDVGRTPNDHVGFGGPGPHFCLGAHLARREIRVMFTELMRRLPDIHVVGEPDRLRSGFINGIKHMRAEWTPVAPSAA